MSSDLLIGAANVIEKFAEYVEAQETKRLSTERQAKLAAANVLADKISQTTGEPVTEEIIEKLAEVPPEVATLFDNLSWSGETVEPLGGPPERDKTASVHTAQDRVQETAAAADTQFVNWLSTSSV